jgi:hypothetical protein
LPEKLPEGQVNGDHLVPPVVLGYSGVEEKKTKSGDKNLTRCKKRELKSNSGVAWGKLLSQCSRTPHVIMNHPTFTVGQGYQCNLWVGNPSVSKSLCTLKQVESESGRPITLLETTGKKGFVQVNGKDCPKKSTLTLNGGDEVVFSSSGKHAYIFQ